MDDVVSVAEIMEHLAFVLSNIYIGCSNGSVSHASVARRKKKHTFQKDILVLIKGFTLCHISP